MPKQPCPFEAKEVQDEILGYLNSGKTFKGACKLMELNYTTGYSYLLRDTVFSGLVAAARSNGADALVDELLEITSEANYDPAKARIKSENIRWVAARLNRTKYGDKLDVTMDTTVNITQAITDAGARAVTMRQAIDITDDCEVIDDGLTSDPESIVG